MFGIDGISKTVQVNYTYSDEFSFRRVCCSISHKHLGLQFLHTFTTTSKIWNINISYSIDRVTDKCNLKIKEYNVQFLTLLLSIWL